MRKYLYLLPILAFVALAAKIPVMVDETTNLSPQTPTFTSATVQLLTANAVYTSDPAAGLTIQGATVLADGTDSNIDLTLTPKGTGEVNLPKVDIDAGTIDGATIGGSTPAAGTFTTLGVGIANQSGFVASIDGDIWQGNAGDVEIGRIFNDSGLWHFRASSNVTGLAFGTNGAEKVRITSGGNVGIGTAAPDNKLTVNGSLAFSYDATHSYNGVKLNGVKTEYFNAITSTPANIIHEFTGFGGAAKLSITEGGNLLLGTESEPTTAARLVVKGSTADGSTDCLTLQDSSGAEVMAVNTDGVVTAGRYELPGDTRYGVAKIYDSSTGDMYGIEQASSSHTGDDAALRLFTAHHDTINPYIAFGKYTAPTTFVEWLRLDQDGKAVFGGDTNIYRSAANVLKTDDAFEAETLTGKSVVTAKTATGNVSVTEAKGQVLTNAGAAGGVVLTLPDAVAGLRVTICVATAQDVDINPQNGDQILVLTDAAGDAISSDATVGSYIELLAISDTEWFPLQRQGTWTDVN